MNFKTFASKEVMENMRTKRILVIMCVFLFMALSGVFMARYLSEFFNMMTGMDDALGDLAAIFPDPTWQDSYIQFFGNIGQVGALTVLLVFLGSILREKRSGSAALVFTKGLSPTTFVLSKFFVASVITLLSTMITLLLNELFTQVLFGESGNFGQIMVAGLLLSFFLILLVSITLFISAAVKSTGVGAALLIFIYFVMVAITAIPGIGHVTPGILINRSMGFAIDMTQDGMLLTIIIAVVLTAVCLFGAVKLTAKKVI